MTFATSDFIGPQAKAYLFWGMYESAEIRFVKKYLRRDLDVVELGSSIGVVSSHIGRKIGPTKRLVCVEANPALMGLLEENVRHNAPGCAAEYVHAAIRAGESPVVSFARAENHLGSRLGGGDAVGSTTEVSVPGIALSDLLRRFNLSDFSLVCDIEGAEAGMILEPGALSRCRQFIAELHDVVFEGRSWTPESLCAAVQEKHGLVLQDRYGPVFFFNRPD